MLVQELIELIRLVSIFHAVPVQLHQNLADFNARCEPLRDCLPFATLAVDFEDVDSPTFVPKFLNDVRKRLCPDTLHHFSTGSQGIGMVGHVGRHRPSSHLRRVEDVHLTPWGDQVLHTLLKIELSIAADRVHEARLPGVYVLLHRVRVAHPLATVADVSQALCECAMEGWLMMVLPPDFSGLIVIVTWYIGFPLHLGQVDLLPQLPQFLRLIDQAEGVL
mmetsp:Transcript_64146/g.118166  ORF Transcript_64146/g.118166 Transcript_64146/m.118166 type:complete len:220 (-) Transcript_64146:218-877(-)